MIITKSKRGKYKGVFHDKDGNITAVHNRLDVLELVELSKEHYKQYK